MKLDLTNARCSHRKIQSVKQVCLSQQVCQDDEISFDACLDALLFDELTGPLQERHCSLTLLSTCTQGSQMRKLASHLP